MRSRDPWHDDEQGLHGYAPEPRAGLSGYMLDLLAANPTATGGSAVVFAFAVAIVANAMFLQPGKHPAPLFTGLHPLAAHAAAAEDAGPAEAAPAPVTDDPAAVMRRVASALAAQGLYRGPADGRASPQLDAAIREFQSLHGMAIDGQASEALLFALGSPVSQGVNHDDAGTVALRPAPANALLPRPRPDPDMLLVPHDAIAGVLNGSAPADGTAGAPADRPAALNEAAVAATPVAAPPARRAVQPAVQAAGDGASDDAPAIAVSEAVAAGTTLADWQRAIAGMDLGPTNTDGILTQQTRDALKQFEHVLGLPEDGIFSDRVISEMRRRNLLK